MVKMNKQIQINVNSGKLPEWEDLGAEEMDQWEDQDTINKLEMELGWKDRQPAFFGGGDLNEAVRDVGSKWS